MNSRRFSASEQEEALQNDGKYLDTHDGTYIDVYPERN